jgi:cobalt/nickel transport system permease protein
VIEEPFADGSTFLHRADPRAKLVLAAALACILAVSSGWQAPSLALGVGAGLVLWARLPGRAFWRRLLTINAFVAFLWAFLPFTTPGEAIGRVGPLAVTSQGLALAMLISLKTNAIMLAFLALVTTSDAAALGQAMHRLRVPAKLVFLFLFTYRFIHVINDERQRLSTAARLRGFKARSNRHTYRTLASLLAMVLVGAMRRAEMTRRAMLLRGFTGSFTTLRTFSMGARERLFLTSGALYAATLVILEALHAD